jgi:hypothetical protein
MLNLKSFLNYEKISSLKKLMKTKVKNYYNSLIVTSLKKIITDLVNINSCKYLNCNINNILVIVQKNIVDNYNESGIHIISNFFSNINFFNSTHVYNSYNTTLFQNSANSMRLRYFNSSDQLVVTDPTA